jgi:uncharacterized protein (AIM24 family)
MQARVEDGLGGVLVVELAAGESVLAASGALVDHTGGASVQQSQRGRLRTVANATSEREHLVEVTAEQATTVRLAPGRPGDVVACELDTEVAVAQGSFLAAAGDVTVGADRLGSAPERGSGLYLRTLSGGGLAVLAGCGRVDRIDLDADEERVASAPHVVGYEADVAATVEAGRATSEAPPTVRFRGPGAVWLQTRRDEG